MIETTQENPNTAQIEFWNGTGGEQWAKNQTTMDAALKPFAAAALGLAAAEAGEHALDIGCGTGVTTLALAEQVGSTGSAVGIDVSSPMITLARQRALAAKNRGRDYPRFEIADASRFNFAVDSVDLLFSRFGVMFFADPTLAFTNMRKSLRSSGRTAFICWQSMQKNDFFRVPLAAALTILPTPEPPPPNAPGPFAFASKDRIAGILKESGFTGVAIESLALVMAPGNGGGVEAACKELIANGPLSRLFSTSSPDQQADVKVAVMNALQDYCTDGMVELNTMTWLVSAKF
jgi:SAM-dependent methyltransferase